MGIVAPVNQGNKTSASTGSLAVTTLANIAQGDLIVVFHNCAQTAGTMGSIVDPAASTYSQGAQQATNPNCAIYYAIAAAAIASGSTITVNFNGGATNRHGVVIWSGAAAGGTWALDVNAGTSTGTATASGTLTYPAQAQAIELLVAMIGADATAPGTVTWDQGFTQLGNTGSVDFVIPAYLISAAASGNTVTPSWVNSILYRTIAVSFQLTPAAAATVNTGNNSDSTKFSGGSTQDFGRRRQKLKLQPEVKLRHYDMPAETQARLQETAKAVAVEKLAEIAEAAEIDVEIIQSTPAPRPPVTRITLRPRGPTWADMERAKADLERLKQDLIARQDEDDVELLLMAIH